MLLACGPVSAQENPSRVAEFLPKQVKAAVRYAPPITIEGAMIARAERLALPERSVDTTEDNGE